MLKHSIRHFRISLFASLTGAAALAVAATPAYALGMDFGVLAPQSVWKIGTVKAKETTGYCAMASTFERDVVLALSRNGDREDSLAIDFRNEFLTAGKDYGATLRAEGGPDETLEAHASTNHSIVISLPSKTPVITALGAGARLWVTLDDVKIAFTLRDFSDSYIALRNCADLLNPGPKTSAVPVTPVEKTALGTSDGTASGSRENVVISNDRADALQSELKIAALEKTGLTQKVEAGERQGKLLQSALDAKQNELLSAERAKSELAQRVEAGERQGKLLKTALETKESELRAAQAKGPAQEAALAAVRAELVSLQKNHAVEIGGLRDELLQKTQELAARATETASVMSELSVVKAERDMLRTRLDTVSAALGMPPTPSYPIMSPPVPLVAPPQKLEKFAPKTKPEKASAVPPEQVDAPVPLMAQARQDALPPPLPAELVVEREPPASDVAREEAPIELKSPIVVAKELPQKKEKEIAVRQEKQEAKEDTAGLFSRLTALVTAAGDRADKAGSETDVRLSGSNSGSVTLESLLDKSGLPISDFTDTERRADMTSSRWNVGFVRGNYEQLAAQKDFVAQMSDYVESYRQDCGGAAQAQMSPAQTTRAGTVATAEVVCASVSRPYTASVVFLKDGNGFSAITHAAHPSQKAAAIDARDKIMDVLQSSRGFSAPQVIAAATPITSDDYDTLVIK